MLKLKCQMKFKCLNDKTYFSHVAAAESAGYGTDNEKYTFLLKLVIWYWTLI